MKSMKKTVKTADVIRAYKVLVGARYQRLEDADKIRVWKVFKSLKPVAVRFEEDRADAMRVLADEGLMEALPRAQEYERLKASNAESLPMTEEEYKGFVDRYAKRLMWSLTLSLWAVRHWRG